MVNIPLIPLNKCIKGRFIFPCANCKYQGRPVNIQLSPSPPQSPYGKWLICKTNLYNAAINYGKNVAPTRSRRKAGALPYMFCSNYELVFNCNNEPSLLSADKKVWYDGISYEYRHTPGYEIVSVPEKDK